MPEDLIDLVARDLTASPVPDLARAVSARLATAPQQRAWPWRYATLAALSTAAAVIAVLALRPASQNPLPNVVSAPPAAASAAVAPPVSTTNAMVGAGAGSAAPRPARRSVPVRAISQVEAEWRARAVAALEPAPPLTIDRIQPDQLTIPLMEIAPIATPAIELPPVGSAGGR